MWITIKQHKQWSNQKFQKLIIKGLSKKIVQNETKDYSQCLEFVVEHQCQKMDIWQAAIKELEIENKNSKEVQIPFLEQRKTSKVDKLKELLEMTSASEIEKEKISSQLEGNRKKVLGAVDLLKEVYSVSPKAEFVQKFSKQMKDLSALEIKNHIQNSVNLMQMQNKQDDTEKAKEPERELNEEVDAELNKAHLSYLEKDQQIQAQTTVNVIKSSESKITEALNFLSQSHDSKFKELKLEKQQLKEDIEQLRTQLQEFEEKTKHNQEKIDELQGKVKSCQNKPQNKEHDCDPIKENAKKELIEVEMMLSRLNLIEEQLNTLMEGKDQVSQSSSEEEQKRKQLLQEQIEGDKKVQEILGNKNMVDGVPVSYTHLTLPTKRIVQISVVAVSLKKKI
eukprot:TRINITY_DN2538_c0_g1_i26.p1 TRINITY_DN2538_c0_g1~~TRINITY_DN2538_c0_g1_i26.p1  ORF type:complete len:394 (+),score=94.96 TRINITY_DN2538_c0_g1_i26:157-1338(+)